MAPDEGAQDEVTWIGALRPPDILARLNPIERAAVLARANRRRLAQDETLFAQGQRHEGVHVIESGVIRTYYTSPAGRAITLAYWKVGNLVGTPEVLSSGIHMWSGVAVGETDVLSFRSQDLRQLMERLPGLAIGLVEALEFKGKCFSALVQMLGTRSVPERLRLLLHNLMQVHGVPHPDGVALGEPFTHEAFAQMVGASRQWVTITLDRLQRDGVLRISKRRIVILKPELLTRPAAGQAVAWSSS